MLGQRKTKQAGEFYTGGEQFTVMQNGICGMRTDVMT
jgi:hypothetical protein